MQRGGKGEWEELRVRQRDGRWEGERARRRERVRERTGEEGGRERERVLGRSTRGGGGAPEDESLNTNASLSFPRGGATGTHHRA